MFYTLVLYNFGLQYLYVEITTVVVLYDAVLTCVTRNVSNESVSFQTNVAVQCSGLMFGLSHPTFGAPHSSFTPAHITADSQHKHRPIV
jgi:hypothetical protein